MNIKRVPCAPDATPGPTPALLYCTCTPQNVGPKLGRVSHTLHNTAHAEHFGGEGVVGGFAANRRLSEAPVAAVYWN